jgi:23S rRNA (cytidine1920-2'-O)/16S rRNA (cytidine1409-2'-O)-methyltransferase
VQPAKGLSRKGHDPARRRGWTDSLCRESEGEGSFRLPRHNLSTAGQIADAVHPAIGVARVALDAGASTGGFTDVLLKNGAKSVIAVDVGYGQLAWELQNDDRVKIFDRVNIRNISEQQIGEKVDLIVADLSFISLKLVIPALVSIAKPDADYLLMVKPQFEVGKDKLGSGGVVRELSLRKSAVQEVAQIAYSHGLGCLGVVASPLPGPSGNVEYFLWLKANAPALLEVDLDHAIEKGPQ